MDVDQVQQRAATVVVVDVDISGYNAVSELAADGRLIVRFLASGRAALRHAYNAACLVWLIGTRLEDMSGFDLHDMLRDRLHGAAICIVASKYCVEDEIRAYQAGATMYLQKPVKVVELIERMLSRQGMSQRQSPVTEAAEKVNY